MDLILLVPLPEIAKDLACGKISNLARSMHEGSCVVVGFGVEHTDQLDVQASHRDDLAAAASAILHPSTMSKSARVLHTGVMEAENRADANRTVFGTGRLKGTLDLLTHASFANRRTTLSLMVLPVLRKQVLRRSESCNQCATLRVAVLGGWRVCFEFALSQMLVQT